MYFLESHLVLLWTGYGPAGYALFVAVYAGLEVCILSFFLTIVLNVLSLIYSLQRFIQICFYMAFEEISLFWPFHIGYCLLWWDFNWIIGFLNKIGHNLGVCETVYFYFYFFLLLLSISKGEKGILCVQHHMLKCLLWCKYARTRTLMKTEDISSPIYLCEHLIFILGFYVFWIQHPHDCFVQ
jgi:hypothetical protein